MQNQLRPAFSSILGFGRDAQAALVFLTYSLLVQIFMSNLSHASSLEWQKASALPGTHRASANELKTLRQQFASNQIAYNFGDANTEVVVHLGDLIVDGSLENDSLLIVQGDLTIKGNYHDYLSDTGVLVVLGQMQVENLYSWGAIYVQKDLNASGLILTVYNDFTFEVAGKVNARALVISDKFNDYRPGKIAVTLTDDTLGEQQQAIALRLFEPVFFTRPDHLEIEADSTLSDLRFDDELGATRIQDGGLIFRSQTAPESLITDVAQVLSESASAQNLSPLIARDPLLAQLIAGRPELPEALHQPLLATQDKIVLEWLARRAPKLVAAQLKKVEITPKTAEKLLEDGSISTATLTTLATSANAEVRKIVGRSAILDAATANRMALDPDIGVRIATISGQLYSLSVDTVTLLSKDSDLEVRKAIAAAPLRFGDFKNLQESLDAEGLAALAESLYSDETAARDARMSESDRQQAIAILIENPKLDATPLLLALPEAQQAAQFDLMVQAKRLDIERMAEHTRSVAVMHKIIALADQFKAPIPNDLASNPKLPLALQRLILERAMASAKDGDDEYGDSPRGALDELMQQDWAADEIVLDTAKFAFRDGYMPADGGYQNSLFHRRNLPRSAIEFLQTKLAGTEDWSLTLLLQLRANPSELKQAIPRWYENDDIKAELMRAKPSDDPGESKRFWRALAQADAKELREVAARNINTPADTLAVLMHDAEESVAYSAQANPNLPSALRLKLALSAKPGELLEAPLTLAELKLLLPKLNGAMRREAMQRMRQLQ